MFTTNLRKTAAGSLIAIAVSAASLTLVAMPVRAAASTVSTNIAAAPAASSVSAA